jgi:hypothetical protein
MVNNPEFLVRLYGVGSVQSVLGGTQFVHALFTGRRNLVMQYQFSHALPV